MKRRAFIGVDPGQTGGIALCTMERAIEAAIAMPLAGKDIDLAAIADFLMAYQAHYTLVGLIEKVSSMPGQGVSSVFKFGFGTGSIHGVFAGLGIPRHVVTPQAWQKFILKDLNRGDKSIAISYVARVYPNVSLLATERSKKPSSGIADAICIARYASYNL